MAEGTAAGKVKGKAEGLFFVARQMKQSGEPVEKIMAFTGLTIEEIMAL